MIHGVIIQRLDDYGQCKRYRVDYIKNGYSQAEVFMKYGDTYKVIETMHYSRNGLRKSEARWLIELIEKAEEENGKK